MTSTQSQSASTPAQNTTAAPSAPSYASAAGATKKPVSTPLVVTGADPSSAAGSSGASSQTVSSAANGRQSIPPAVPTIANGTSSQNGDGLDHNRNGSVSITAPGNGFANATPGIQFGFDKTPQPSAAVPIPAGQIPTPAQSPAPIPRPSASGGKPGATESQFKIGSFPNEGDRMAAMRGNNPASMSFNDHSRRGSNVSEMALHGGPPGPTRGGFSSGRGGRGASFAPQQYNHQAAGFPPQGNFRGAPYGSQGRGGPPPNAYRGMFQPNSPRPSHNSPHMPNANLGHTGTPNMSPAMTVPQSTGSGPYPVPMSQYQYPQVGIPFSQPDVPISFGQKHNTKKPNRRNENPSHSRRTDSSLQSLSSHKGNAPQHFNKRRVSTAGYDQSYNPGPLLEYQTQPSHLIDDISPSLDLAPGPKYDRVKQMLTDSKQGYNSHYGPPPPNMFGAPPFMGVPSYAPQMGYNSQGNPGQVYYGPPQPFQQAGPQAQPMSRGNSQMSEQRPASSTGPQGPLGASGAPPPSKGPVIASSGSSPNTFQRPTRVGKAIVVKNANGEEIDLKALKTPASPASLAQQSKTPPIIASTPTPPPKAATPNPHARNESAANQNDIKATFAAQVLEKVKGDSQSEPKTEDTTAVDDKAKETERKQEEERVQAEQKAADAKAAEIKAAEDKAAEDKAAEDKAAEAKAVADKAVAEKAAEVKAAETNAAEEAEKTAKASVSEQIKAEPESKAEEPAFVGMLPGETEDEYFDRLEAEDAQREAEQAEITAKKNAEKAAAKKAADSETAEEKDRKLREQEREMERIETEKEHAREQREKAGGESQSVAELLASKISGLTSSSKKETSDNGDKLSKLTINSSLQAPAPGSAPSSAKSIGSKDRRPAALNLAPLKTGSVEAPPQSAAMQALKSSRFLTIKDEIKYPAGIASPNPSINATAAKKGGSFKYDSTFLLQFQKVFTEQPSAEFSQQVKALIGDSGGDRSASTRGSRGLDTRSNSKNASGVGNFGAFAQPSGGKTLPSGTTSQERFAMSQGQMQRPAVGGPMASFSRGAFPSGGQIGRAPSGMGGMGSRQGSTRNTQPRGNSKQGKGYDIQSGKDAKNMPLTAGMDLKPIQVSSTGWKPMSLQRNASQPVPGADHLDPATVQRKVKSNLNKMTPENFDKISGQILAIAAQSKDEQDGRTLRQVIQLTFEKATDEAHWAAMYAKFCQCMLENMSPEVKDVTITDKAGNVVSGGALFRKYLLNRCQEDFERGWNTDMPVPKDGESKEAALMSDEYYKAMAIKRRGLGLIQFIGELFRLGMLTERIMHECVRKLLDFSGEPDEAEIESLTKLLRTIGADLENTEKGSGMMNAYFQRIQSLVDSPGLPSRLQFMLMDIIDLRKAKWVSKDGLKGPKTREEIRADAEAQAAAKAAEQSRNNNNRGYQGQGQGRYGSGRGDSRGGHGGFPPNPASTNVAMDDLRRLKGSASRTASGNVTLGPTSLFNSRSNSGRKMGPGGSLTRGADDSGGSSRTGTPGPAASSNTFAALAAMSNNEDGPASPPSAAASPALNHAKPDKSAN